MKDGQPVSNAEWQDAADQAELHLMFDSARGYGLISGGPVIHVDRCLQLLSQAKRRGITPSPDCIERWAKSFSTENQHNAPAPTDSTGITRP